MAKGHLYLPGFGEHVLVYFLCPLWAKKLQHIPLAFLFTVLVTQLCPTRCDPLDCNPPGSSVHRIFQARIPEWVAISFSRGSS